MLGEHTVFLIGNQCSRCGPYFDALISGVGEGFLEFEDGKDEGRSYFPLLCSNHVWELALAHTLQLSSVTVW